MKRVTRIPKDFEVQPLKPGQKAESRATCGHCGLSWDDAIPTTCTPAPAARCPFEYFHVYEPEPLSVQDELLDALYMALPYVEEAAGDPCNKPGAVAKVVRQIRKAIERADKS